MSTTNAITEERGQGAVPPGDDFREVAPSIMREDQPQLGRFVGLCGLVFLLVGADLLCWAVYQASILRALVSLSMRVRGAAIPEGGPPLGALGTVFGALFFGVGLCGLLFHAFEEKELQRRRVYGVVSALWLVLGLVLLVCNFANVGWAAPYFLPALGALLLALLFGLSFLRNEAEVEWRTLALNGVLLLGAAMVLTAFIASFVFADFLLPRGLLLALLGLVYLWAFIVYQGTDKEVRYRVGLGVAAVGAFVLLLTLVLAYIVPLVRPSLGPVGRFMLPNGVLLCGLGLLYVLFFVVTWAETRVVVMARRELASFFYSPIAYIVLLAFTLIGVWDLLWFLGNAIQLEPMQRAQLFEPVVRYYLFGLFPVFAIIIIVPVLTMRLLSEERRTGTLEQMLTIPVDEWSIVVSKFLGTLVFFLLLWVPWLVFLLAVRVEGREPFQLAPVLSFLIALVCMGANFVGMGLFFSSLTRNQIIGAVLTCAGMFAWLFTYFGANQLRDSSPNSPWIAVLTHMSFVDLWFNSTEGRLQPEYLIFQLTAAFLWLFLTVKVLEARRWT
jgi:ABC-2 type transport system permease protein